MVRYVQRKKNGKVKVYSGLGSLKDGPLFYSIFECAKCGLMSKFGHSTKCTCYTGERVRRAKVKVGGIIFDSKAEGLRYSKLKFMESQKIISDLILQPKFVFIICNQKLCTYSADFRYFFEGKKIVEDVKGVVTDVFALKVRIFKILFPDELLDLV